MERGEPLTLRAGGVERPLCDIAGSVTSAGHDGNIDVTVVNELCW